MTFFTKIYEKWRRFVSVGFDLLIKTNLNFLKILINLLYWVFGYYIIIQIAHQKILKKFHINIAPERRLQGVWAFEEGAKKFFFPI